MALLLCSFLMAACGSGGGSANATQSPASAAPSANPTAEPLAFAQQWKLGQVEDIAVSPTAVYTLYTPASIQGAVSQVTDNRLARIDRSTGTVITAGPFPYAQTVAVAGGAVWMGGNNQYPATPYPGSSTLTGVDATTLQMFLQLSFPGSAHQAVATVAGDADSLWVAYGASIYRLPGRGGGSVVSHAIGGIATSIALDEAGHRVYVGDNGVGGTGASVIELDAATLKPLVSSDTGGGGLGGPHVAAGTNDLWISYATGMLGAVEHRQASNLALLTIVDTRHTNGVSVYTAGGMVWVSDSMAGQIMCLDPTTGAVRAIWDTQFGGVVAGDGAQIYVGDLNGVGLLKLDSRCR